MMDARSSAYSLLLAMVHKSWTPPYVRTEEDEDRMALEDLIISHEGSEALERYREKWKREGRP